MISLVASNIIYPELILRTTVSLTTSLITSYKYLSTVSKTTDVDLHTMLQTNDIIFDINVIKTYVEERQKDGNLTPTINMCIEHLNNTLQDLEENINYITRKLQIHKTLWFGYFRSYNIEAEKKEIPLLIEKMRHRFDMLIKISSCN
jgi:hypothetical protein